MGEASSLTAARMLEIERASVVFARRENGELILVTRGGTDINVGDVTGLQGPPGEAGPPRYTWLKYATTPTSGMSDDPSGKNYIGLAYNKTTPIETNDYADYQWSLIRGPEGENGVPGPPGDDGQPTYVWIKYATDEHGNNMSDSPINRDYIGLAYNKTTIEESTDPNDYTWALIKGPKGDKGDPGTDGLPGPPGTNGESLYTWLKYADTPTTGMSDNPTDKNYIGLAFNRGTPTESLDYGDYQWSLIKGADGSDGVPGPPGDNGQPTYVWIKYATTISGDSLSDDPTGRDYIGLAYNKTTTVESLEPLDYIWSLYKGVPGQDGRGISDSAISYQASSSGTLIPTGTWLVDPPTVSAGQYLWTRTVTYYTEAPLTVTSYSVGQMGQNGAPGVSVTGAVVRYQLSGNGTTPPIGTWLVDPPSGSPGQYFWTRTVTTYSAGADTVAYSVALLGETGPKGDPGDPGEQGLGVMEVIRYYQLAMTTPDSPTEVPPPEEWVQAEPGYVAGSEDSLWFVDLTIFSDNSFSYSVISKSSSYEAAKSAYGVAIFAQQTADGLATMYSAYEPPPSTEGFNNNDIWNYFDIDDESLKGQFRYDSERGIWVEYKINSEWLGFIDAGKIVAGVGGFGYLNADVLQILPRSKVEGLDDELGLLNTANSELDDRLTPISDVITIADGVVEIGASEDQSSGIRFLMRLTSNKLQFSEDGVEVAYVASQKMFINNAEVATTPGTSMMLGAHEISIGGTGSLLNKVTNIRSLG